METVRGAKCYVIDAVEGPAHHTIWIDPQRGHNIVKATYANDKNVIGKDILKVRQSQEVAKFKRVNGVWIPVEVLLASSSDGGPGRSYQVNARIKASRVELNPDHEALGSFLPGDVKDGTTVHIVRKPSVKKRGTNYHRERGELAPVAITRQEPRRRAQNRAIKSVQEPRKRAKSRDE
jgi:hypothetical protein